MANVGITAEQVFAAADSLQREAREPTIQAIRGQLGTGSLTTISRHLKAWRNRSANAASAAGQLPSIAGASAEELVAALRSCHPQVIAVALSHLEPAHAADVVCRLPKSDQEDVVARIGTLAHVAPHVLAILNEAFKRELQHVRDEAQRTGGPSYVATLRQCLGKVS